MDRPIRVLLVNDHLGFGNGLHGVGRWFLNIIPNFDPQQVSVRPVILRRRNSLAELFEERGIQITFLGRGKLDPRALTDLMRIIREERIDVIHVQGLKADVLGRLAGKIAGVPAIMHQRDENALPPFYLRLLDRMIGPRTSHAIAVSESVAQFLVKWRAIPPGRIQVLGNPVDLEQFSPPASGEREQARRSLQVALETPVLASVARLHPVKGLIFLIRAMPRILGEYPDCRLLIAGTGDEEALLRTESTKLGVNHRVSFLGFRRDVRQLMAALDILVLPSLSEGFPNAMLEGMAMGRCLVASRVGGMAQILEHEQTALLVSPASAIELADACLRVLSDRELRSKLEEASRARAQNFSVKGMTTQLTELYGTLAAGRR